ncbi:MAG: MFS transporter [Arcanobacterium sp.]|nr:MFS transporter [Arcanobacterium sp.]MDY5589805.1 MFS transporter [Arcanobacterium sp.]
MNTPSASHSEHRPTHRQSLTVFICALSVYVLAIAARTSLGMTGVTALERFHTDATGLAFFSTLQLFVYGGAQIPMGIALDRFGPRRMLTIGAVMVACAQAGMALAPSYGWALAVRALLGAGDATAFISVLRLLPSWFSPRFVPLLTQIASLAGMLGQLISAYPFLAAIQIFGWQPTFLAMAALGVGTAAISSLGVANFPHERQLHSADTPHSSSTPWHIGGKLRSMWHNPWVWYGFFTHWSTSGLTMVFTLLWGVPLLTEGMHLSSATASALIALIVFGNAISGLALGKLSASHPHARFSVIVAAHAALMGAWVLLLSHPQPPHEGWALLLVAVISVVGMVSMYAFDLVRVGTPAQHLGVALGAVNMGGFLCALISVLAIGEILDLLAPNGAWDWATMRAACAVQAAPWIIGLIGVLIADQVCRRTAQYAAMR